MPIEDEIEAGEEVGQKSNLCTLCSHDLNCTFYDIRSHPKFKAPLCLLCFDQIEAELEEYYENKSVAENNAEEGDESDDICCWCAEGGDLLCCSICSHAFCSDCLSDKISSAYCQQALMNDAWHCLVCDDRPLEPLKIALARLLAHSMYTSRVSPHFHIMLAFFLLLFSFSLLCVFLFLTSLTS